ncbi:hypothetical protein J3R30DRAFT_3421395 [Lentinula aciculospora]|uniref:Uncharacterized protein n=1 Tax=Lentinula aciculospora TaxID=153920 RepID=A0A9W9ATV8_9AGAR|nr:hypothetical protein J3R30DRAFT_3421395 [Lentinula aciculospora]
MSSKRLRITEDNWDLFGSHTHILSPSHAQNKPQPPGNYQTTQLNGSLKHHLNPVREAVLNSPTMKGPRTSLSVTRQVTHLPMPDSKFRQSFSQTSSVSHPSHPAPGPSPSFEISDPVEDLRERLTQLDDQKLSPEHEVNRLRLKELELSENLKKKEEMNEKLKQKNAALETSNIAMLAHLQDSKDIILHLKWQNNKNFKDLQEKRNQMVELEGVVATVDAAKDAMEKNLHKKESSLRHLSKEFLVQANINLHLSGECKRIEDEVENLRRENNIFRADLNRKMVLIPKRTPRDPTTEI